VKSLNVSVAAGVVLFEAVRQRRASAGKKPSPAQTPVAEPTHKKPLPTD
jgi:hypothetical protein